MAKNTLYKYVTGGKEITFHDNEGQYSPEQIKAHWAGSFPELAQAETKVEAFDEPQEVTFETDGEQVTATVDQVVTFEKQVQTLGQNGGTQFIQYVVELSHMQRQMQGMDVTERQVLLQDSQDKLAAMRGLYRDGSLEFMILDQAVQSVRLAWYAVGNDVAGMVDHMRHFKEARDRFKQTVQELNSDPH